MARVNADLSVRINTRALTDMIFEAVANSLELDVNELDECVDIDVDDDGICIDGVVSLDCDVVTDEDERGKFSYSDNEQINLNEQRMADYITKAIQSCIIKKNNVHVDLTNKELDYEW